MLTVGLLVFVLMWPLLGFPDPLVLGLIALFEAAKGALILLAGFGLLELVHRDLQHVADDPKLPEILHPDG